MANEFDHRQALRPVIQGTRHMVSACHYLAAHAGFSVLEAGGNAIDAGVAAGIATDVLEHTIVGLGGVAPIMIYTPAKHEVSTISGLGWWPKKASVAYFREYHAGKIPKTLHRCVVPAAPDAWITALELYGSMQFGEVAAAGIRFAREGFPVYPLFSHVIEIAEECYRENPSNAAIFLPDGRVPQPGEVFRQEDLARTIEYMADEERAAGGSREAGLRAARDAFYKGDIARAIAAHHEENGGLITAEDLAGFRVTIEPPVKSTFRDIDVYSCGPWCQGPMLLQALNVLNTTPLQDLGHNSAEYIHVVTEAIKLAAADRDAYYGDPRFVDVPIEELLSMAYSEGRRRLIRSDTAWPCMPPAGDVGGKTARVSSTAATIDVDPADEVSAYDTSYVCAIDRHGNVFSCTPSDGTRAAAVISGLGIVPSTRGSQSWVDETHPSCVAPGKRPRLTPNPAIAIKAREFVQPFGTPGGDVQVQAMLQTFLNVHVFGMSPGAAVEAPRFATYSFPSSFEPHDYHPGKLFVESRISASIGESLSARGHDVDWWPDWCWKAGSVCTIISDQRSGIMTAAADPRRNAYSCGW